jgi:hypothetical protein
MLVTLFTLVTLLLLSVIYERIYTRRRLGYCLSSVNKYWLTTAGEIVRR